MKYEKQKTHLVNELTTMYILVDKDLRPKLWLTTFHQITSLLFEHRVIIGDRNKLVIAKAFGIGNVCQVWVPFLTKLSDDQWFIQLNRSTE
jgi:hypothetical protein